MTRAAPGGPGKARPSVAVVVPVRNESATLRSLAAALAAQTSAPAEAVFVDTGSGDDSIAVLRDCCDVLARAGIAGRVVTLADGFPGGARNAGVAASSSPLIAFVDAGIEPAPDWLESLLECHSRSAAQLVWGFCRFDAEERMGRVLCALSYGVATAAPVVPATLVTRAAFVASGGFDPRYRAGEDLLWRQAVAARGLAVVECPRAQVLYRHFPATLGAAVAKWFRYEVHFVRAFGLGRRTLRHALLAAILAWAVASPMLPWLPLATYLAARGVADPIRRSRVRRWWRDDLLAFLLAPPVALAIDLASLAGHVRGAMDGRQDAPRPAGRPARLCFVVAAPMTAKAFLSQPIAALAAGHSVDLVADASGPAELGALAAHCTLRPVPIRRRASPLRDLAALASLVGLFRKQGYDVVHSVTPKAGLLSLLGGVIAGVPVRVHTFTGQVWVTRQGIARRILKGVDMLMARLATHLLADSPSQRDFLIREGVAHPGRIRVLGEGAICGVDGNRFRPDAQARARIRAGLGIPSAAPVFLFLGRLNRDKGVLELANAFAGLADAGGWLLVVGPDEAGMQPAMAAALGAAAARARFVGYTDRPEDYMAASDVFCLPSHREGFGMVIVEAAAAGLPAVASRIYGITDAVVEGETGLLHAPGDVDDLRRCLARLLADRAERERLGSAARRRSLDAFSAQRLTGAWQDYYRGLAA